MFSTVIASLDGIQPHLIMVGSSAAEPTKHSNHDFVLAGFIYPHPQNLILQSSFDPIDHEDHSERMLTPL